MPVKIRERRISQQSRDLNLAIILIATVIMFFCCHLPRYSVLLLVSLTMLFRLVTSVYEAANIHHILECRERGRNNTPLWFMYVTAAVQLTMVWECSSVTSASFYKCWRKFQRFKLGFEEIFETSFYEKALKICSREAIGQ